MHFAEGDEIFPVRQAMMRKVQNRHLLVRLHRQHAFAAQRPMCCAGRHKLLTGGNGSFARLQDINLGGQDGVDTMSVLPTCG